jgi:signal-transduction protein with cAMP-binding, CBS, and nucleotidyltransferase domain
MNEKRRYGNDRRMAAQFNKSDRRNNSERRFFIRSAEITIGRLRIMPLFQNLTMEQYHKILRICSKVSYSKDNIIFTMGDTPVSMFIVIDGKLRAIFPDNREIIRISPKDAIGIMEFIKKEKHSFTLSADTDCVMISLNNEEFLSVLENDKAMWIKILSNLVNELYGKLINENNIIKNLYNSNIMEIFNLTPKS